MLSYLEFFSEKHKAEEENINGVLHGWVGFYLFPGFFHFVAPVNIIKYEDGTCVCFLQELMEVTDRRLVAVVAVDVCKINRW